MNFESFFTAATGNEPYLWQCRLADGEQKECSNSEFRNNDEVALDLLSKTEPARCQSRLIDIPTGLGKTAGVILAWLWNRVVRQGNDWPRRLVYCLPMRTLVEQTTDHIEKWIASLLDKADALGLHDSTISDLEWLQLNSPIVLMGGEDPDREWDLWPEKPAILTGTQDMLLSRALNRGYGMSRYRWPMHYALLNNDSLWVMDEIQLMGAGLASTTQLEGFRNTVRELGSFRCHSWWMSATIRPQWLKTVDMPEQLLTAHPLKLTGAEKSDGSRVEALRTAPKIILRAPVDSGSNKLKEVAHFIMKEHSSIGLNLVVLNTVQRARELHRELRKIQKSDSPDLLLIHSQFRPADRQHVLNEIRGDSPGRIVVSTQVIEAGVDISAHTLFTELAPWSSLVQRFGRCNRWLLHGQHQYDDSRIFWFDLPDEKDSLPYHAESTTAAKDRLTLLVDAAIQNLEKVESPDADHPEFRHVIRRKDLLDLFDTTPDLAGADLDIDRFIRDTDDSHVQVFWREWLDGPKRSPDENESPSAVQSAPHRNELCPVSIGDFKKFIKKEGPAWRWDPLNRKWQKISDREIYPGQTYLLHTGQGGYNQSDNKILIPTGWTGDPKSKVSPLAVPDKECPLIRDNEAYDADQASSAYHWKTVAHHTDEVCMEAEKITNALQNELTTMSASLDIPVTDILWESARWHDWGKAHPAFQSKLKLNQVEMDYQSGPFAKAPPSAWIQGTIRAKQSEGDNRRPHFRHELASALAVLLPDSGFSKLNGEHRDLVAYLIAAHHGKVRLSIRSMPDEWQPPKDNNGKDRRFARGVWDYDQLPATDLGCGTISNPVSLCLEPMELGLGESEPFLNQPSWTERCLNLRNKLGVFTLAYLELLLRAADGRASKMSPGENASIKTSEHSGGEAQNEHR